MSRTHPGRFHIAIPGPTNIPERILNAMHISSEDQRNPEIPNLTIPLYKDVKKVFKSESGTVFLFPGSGTGAWESAIINTMSPNEKVLIYRYGQFSHLWADMFKRLGLDKPNETINLAKKAAAKGGKLTMEEMMKRHGV